MSKNTLLILKWNYQVWNLVKILPLLQLSHLKKYDCDETQRNVKYLQHSIVMHFWANLQALIYREGGGATQVGGDKEWEGTKRTWQPRKMGPASSLYKKKQPFLVHFIWLLHMCNSDYFMFLKIYYIHNFKSNKHCFTKRAFSSTLYLA